MATKRITVSVPADVATRIRQAAGRTHSVSEWVTKAVTRSLEEEDVQRRFLEFCDAVEVTASDIRRVNASFDQITQTSSRADPRASTRGSHTKNVRRRGKTAA